MSKHVIVGPDESGNPSSVQMAGAVNAQAVTPGATVLNPTKALWVGGAGNVVVTMTGGESVTFSSVPAGTLLPVSVTNVASSSTATNIVALY